MDPMFLLIVFISVKLLQHGAEVLLARLNRRYYLDPSRQREAQRILGISDEDMGKTLRYSLDKFRFAQVSGWISLGLTLVFLGLQGLGWVESLAKDLAASVGGETITTGLFFFGLLGLLSMLVNLPFAYYQTFKLEERHGFNRQTVKSFIGDRVKGIFLGAILGGILLSGILWIMERTGPTWWIYAWLALTGFSVVTAWLYPILISPLFNKFSPLQDGELKDKILALALKIGFKAGSISIMDGSKRSSHGNAYFTGMFGAKKIVLFDTLVEAMSPSEVVAVLAHELGHFKLHHVRWSLIRSTVMTGVTFYLLSLCLPLQEFYQGFGMGGVSTYGALIVFTMWFGLFDFFLQPLETYVSRRNEFAADAFARLNLGDAKELGTALMKLREKSQAMPITHPLFSAMYYSHPPLLERLKAMGVAVAQ